MSYENEIIFRASEGRGRDYERIKGIRLDEIKMCKA